MQLAGVEAAPLLAALHDASAAPGWAAEAFGRLLVLPGCFALVEARGFALARVAADEAELLMLAVVPSARRQGIGTMLLRAAMAHAAGQGAARIFLEVAAANGAARALYAASGFRQVGRRGSYYADGGDALVLAAPLSPPS
jgi:ribosomal-protein-alanine N-acetyltransferase